MSIRTNHGLRTIEVRKMTNDQSDKIITIAIDDFIQFEDLKGKVWGGIVLAMMEDSVLVALYPYKTPRPTLYEREVVVPLDSIIDSQQLLPFPKDWKVH